MVYDQSGNRKRFASPAPTQTPPTIQTLQREYRGEQPEHPAAFRTAFDTASDEKQFLSDLEYVLVSIAALMCCTPAGDALTDERVQRMLLALQGFSTPYLQSRFKQEAQQVANRKSTNAELYIRSRKQSKFPKPAAAVVEFLRNDNTRESRSKFFEMKKLAEQQVFEKKQRREKLRLLKKPVAAPVPPWMQVPDGPVVS